MAKKTKQEEVQPKRLVFKKVSPKGMQFIHGNCESERSSPLDWVDRCKQDFQAESLTQNEDDFKTFKEGYAAAIRRYGLRKIFTCKKTGEAVHADDGSFSYELKSYKLKSNKGWVEEFVKTEEIHESSDGKTKYMFVKLGLRFTSTKTFIKGSELWDEFDENYVNSKHKEEEELMS